MKEPDNELYWLFKHVEKSDNFDQPLSKDNKILKILYQNEKEERSQDKNEGGKDSDAF